MFRSPQLLSPPGLPMKEETRSLVLNGIGHMALRASPRSRFKKPRQKRQVSNTALQLKEVNAEKSVKLGTRGLCTSWCMFQEHHTSDLPRGVTILSVTTASKSRMSVNWDGGEKIYL